MDTLDIRLTPHENEYGRHRTAVELWVNGLRLIALVEEFERSKSFDPAGGYDWISLRWLAGGGTFGQPDARTTRETTLLVCQCHEVGCWPLNARVEMGGSTVEWAGFRQPHRPERDYADFHFYSTAGNMRSLSGTLLARRDAAARRRGWNSPPSDG